MPWEFWRFLELFWQWMRHSLLHNINVEQWEKSESRLSRIRIFAPGCSSFLLLQLQNINVSNVTSLWWQHIRRAVYILKCCWLADTSPIKTPAKQSHQRVEILGRAIPVFHTVSLASDTQWWITLNKARYLGDASFKQAPQFWCMERLKEFIDCGFPLTTRVTWDTVGSFAALQANPG